MNRGKSKTVQDKYDIVVDQAFLSDLDKRLKNEISRGLGRKGAKNGAINNARVLKEEVHDHAEIVVPWPLDPFNDDVIYMAPKFSLCRTTWSLAVSVVDGMDTGSSLKSNGTSSSARSTGGSRDKFLSLHLVNLHDKEIKARYSFTLRAQQNDKNDVTWCDSEGLLTFSSVKHGNNEWGCDELISMSALVEGYVSDRGIMTIGVDVFVQGGHDLSTNDSLAQAIEDDAEDRHIIQLVDEDLADVAARLPVQRNLEAQKQQEDHVLHVRTHAGLPPSRK